MRGSYTTASQGQALLRFLGNQCLSKEPIHSYTKLVKQREGTGCLCAVTGLQSPWDYRNIIEKPTVEWYSGQSLKEGWARMGRSRSCSALQSTVWTHRALPGDRLWASLKFESGPMADPCRWYCSVCVLHTI